MKVRLNIYEEDKPNIELNWGLGDSFEKSVVDSVLGKDNAVLAQRYGNCFHKRRRVENEF